MTSIKHCTFLASIVTFLISFSILSNNDEIRLFDWKTVNYDKISCAAFSFRHDISFSIKRTGEKSFSAFDINNGEQLGNLDYSEDPAGEVDSIVEGVNFNNATVNIHITNQSTAYGIFGTGDFKNIKRLAFLCHLNNNSPID